LKDEIQRAARTFVRDKLPVAHLRALRDTHDPLRLSRAIWRESGWAGIAIPEELGGAGLDVAEAGVVLEECGRTLAPPPMLATSILGATCVLGGPPALQREVLPAVAAGERLLAVAFEETPRFAPEVCATRAVRAGPGWRLDGEKVFVLDGPAADQLVVSATTDDGVALFLLDRAAVEIPPLAMVDSRGTARVRLAGVEVGDDRRLGGADLLARAISRATAALTAEMLGGIEEVFARTLAYLKERKQFGVPIGSFQALKHRAAYMFCEIELTRSVVLAALATPDDPLLVSAAKARASDTFVLVSGEAIQMHGGIGATDELDIGFYYKRARVAEMTFGTSAYHRDRFGRLQGY
jgi:alkylation response protein AidB-like acyl-CoA dehydrogenase